MRWYDKLYWWIIGAILLGLLGYFIVMPLCYYGYGYLKFKLGGSKIITETVKVGDTEYIIVGGTKEDIEVSKRVVDPAFNILLRAEKYYDEKEYDLALSETKKALEQARSNIVKKDAHFNLADIYEATKRYDLAIQEIDWLLENVPEHAKPELLKKKEELQKLLSEQKK